jgi:hypothetical protein
MNNKDNQHDGVSEFAYRENTNTLSQTSEYLRKRAERLFPVGTKPRTHKVHQWHKDKIVQREIEFVTATWSHPENANLQRQKFHTILNYLIKEPVLYQLLIDAEEFPTKEQARLGRLLKRHGAERVYIQGELVWAIWTNEHLDGAQLVEDVIEEFEVDLAAIGDVDILRRMRKLEAEGDEHCCLQCQRRGIGRA